MCHYRETGGLFHADLAIYGQDTTTRSMLKLIGLPDACWMPSFKYINELNFRIVNLLNTRLDELRIVGWITLHGCHAVYRACYMLSSIGK